MYVAVVKVDFAYMHSGCEPDELGLTFAVAVERSAKLAAREYVSATDFLPHLLPHVLENVLRNSFALLGVNRYGFS